mmetsp:Transcript_40747/g.68102  ORF Transcript_40747/g.68102 Transcript_40747/m.68102 type:complete len:104 (-) Transcript_40747:723-1034(-)
MRIQHTYTQRLIYDDETNQTMGTFKRKELSTPTHIQHMPPNWNENSTACIKDFHDGTTTTNHEDLIKQDFCPPSTHRCSSAHTAEGTRRSLAAQRRKRRSQRE